MSSFIPWFAPETDEREIRSVEEVLKSQYINEGQWTREFEKKMAEFLGVKHAVAVTSGTSALSLSLMALGLGPSDEVLIPDLTFIATANAARLAGCSVRLVDVEPKRLTICMNSLEKRLTSKSRAVIPVDVNGRGADYSELRDFCKRKGLHLITDSAEALGSRFKGEFLGTTGELGCLSFSANKTLSTGQGGMILTQDTRLWERLAELKDQGRRFQGTGGNDRHPVLGFNFKFTNVLSAIGLAQFEKLQTRLQKAMERDRWYQEELQGVSGLSFPDMTMEGEIRQWTDILSPRADLLEAELKKQQIGSRRFWFPLHTQEPYADDEKNFQVATQISKQGLWLPSYFGLKHSEVKRVCEVVRKVLAS